MPDLVKSSGYICYTYHVFRVFFVYVPVDFDFLHTALFCMFDIPNLSKQFPKLGEVVGNITLIVQIFWPFPWQLFEDYKSFFSILTRFFNFSFMRKGSAEGLEDFTLLPYVRNVLRLSPDFFFLSSVFK